MSKITKINNLKNLALNLLRNHIPKYKPPIEKAVSRNIVVSIQNKTRQQAEDSMLNTARRS
ncbi:MAG: hypothetical protein J6M05_02740 [Cardiobacteriaceae bacterium]|nr:hypothetical protein [Cardiobacteriaceae bacterium]